MTAEAVGSSAPLPDRQPLRGGTPAIMVRLIRESYAQVQPRAREATQFFYAMLFAIAPATRELFAANMEVQRSRFWRALVHIVQNVDRAGELVPFLHQLGRDHRKFGMEPQHYDAMGTALLATLKQFAGPAWTPSVERAWRDAYSLIVKTMREAADAEPGPAWWTARIADHQRLTWDLAVVRVIPDRPVPYQPGQYVSVEIPQRPRLWRYLSPANAPRPDGSIEFHIRAVPGGSVSRAIVSHSQVGDTWRIGAPMGVMTVDREAGRDVLMVAGGTGTAPMRAIVEDLSRWGENPQVTLFAGARVRADLHDLDTLTAIAATNPWLTVVPVVESPQRVPGMEHGTLADAVTRSGSWPDRDVLICGSPAMIRATVSRMLVAGTPLDRITYDPFTLD
ncbi:MAG TPA: globin domain-containing protein [Pseudonocardiaceae bacterium]|nr:globin domain-containing protein [Pseudonocardiaceae bacterium]